MHCGIGGWWFFCAAECRLTARPRGDASKGSGLSRSPSAALGLSLQQQEINKQSRAGHSLTIKGGMRQTSTQGVGDWRVYWREVTVQGSMDATRPNERPTRVC